MKLVDKVKNMKTYLEELSYFLYIKFGFSKKYNDKFLNKNTNGGVGTISNLLKKDNILTLESITSPATKINPSIIVNANINPFSNSGHYMSKNNFSLPKKSYFDFLNSVYNNQNVEFVFGNIRPKIAISKELSENRAELKKYNVVEFNHPSYEIFDKTAMNLLNLFDTPATNLATLSVEFNEDYTKLYLNLTLPNTLLGSGNSFEHNITDIRDMMGDKIINEIKGGTPISKFIKIIPLYEGEKWLLCVLGKGGIKSYKITVKFIDDFSKAKDYTLKTYNVNWANIYPLSSKTKNTLVGCMEYYLDTNPTMTISSIADHLFDCYFGKIYIDKYGTFYELDKRPRESTKYYDPYQNSMAARNYLYISNPEVNDSVFKIDLDNLLFNLPAFNVSNNNNPTICPSLHLKFYEADNGIFLFDSDYGTDIGLYLSDNNTKNTYYINKPSTLEFSLTADNKYSNQNIIHSIPNFEYAKIFISGSTSGYTDHLIIDKYMIKNNNLVLNVNIESNKIKTDLSLLELTENIPVHNHEINFGNNKLVIKYTTVNTNEVLNVKIDIFNRKVSDDRTEI